jgi:hypothetical protein
MSADESTLGNIPHILYNSGERRGTQVQQLAKHFYYCLLQSRE